jgi:hypothetical protein
MSYFIKIRYNNYNNYNNINNSIYFKGINIIKVLIPSPKSYSLNLILINIKYYLIISPFNLIFMS